MRYLEPKLPAAPLNASEISAPLAPAEPAFDLARFTLADMVRCGGALRHLAAGSASMEEAAQKITRYLYERLVDRTSNQRDCVLVRLFKTHPYAGLTEELREFASSMASTSVTADTKCLILLASAGDGRDGCRSTTGSGASWIRPTATISRAMRWRIRFASTIGRWTARWAS